MDEYRYRQDERSDFPILFTLRDPHPRWMNSQLIQVVEWCEARYGLPLPGGDRARWWVSATTGDVMFRDRNDAIEFKLRWT